LEKLHIRAIGYSGNDLHQLCEDHGVDRKKYFLIGFGCGEFTINGIGQNNTIYCRALVLEKSKYGSSFDEIQKSITDKGGNAKAKQIHFKVDPTVFTKYIKRFDFMVATKLTAHISNIEIEDVI
jgi:hypothetical protein